MMYIKKKKGLNGYSISICINFRHDVISDVTRRRHVVP